VYRDRANLGTGNTDSQGISLAAIEADFVIHQRSPLSIVAV